MTAALFRSGTSPVHRLNPTTKLVLALAVTTTAFAIPNVWAPLALLLLVLVPAVLVAGVGREYFRLLPLLAAPVAITVFLLQGLFFPEGETVLAEFGPAVVTEEGLLFAALTALRLVAMLGSFLFLLLTTHPGALLGAMVERGMSTKISYVVSATLQIVPAFRERARSVLRAQQARGLDTTRRRARTLLPLVGPLLLGALADLEGRAVAMEARAFGATGRRTSLVEAPDSPAQRVARLLMGAVAVAAVVVNVLGVVR
ncbi:energy-coupling factor transporter transmembrane component T family protein [Actinosynnema pretiosum]|uniref:energy-coupling factor transporter transmembrane component T family protein n=2 Tax=Actinosynnema TaxID=40566 RepID=UPI0012FDE247|nr:energy-coupling factor transporter transmembrane component T [Actinosynnema pretiosum]